MAYPSGEKDRVQYWARQIDHAGTRLKPYFEAADILIKQYENDPSSDREEGFDFDEDPHTQRVKANLVFGWIDQSISNLLERHPHFTTMPLQRDSSDGSPVVSSVLNYWYRETNQKQQDERILLDAFLAPYGVKKIGWKTDLDKLIYEVVEEPEFSYGDDIESELNALLSGSQTAVTDEQNHEFHIEAKTELLQQPEPLDPLVERNIEANIEAHRQMQDRADPDPSSNVQYGAPFGLRWRPDHFFMDPLAQEGLADAQWIAFKIIRRVDDVKANPSYSNTDDLESSSRPEDAPPVNTGDVEDDFGLVTLYEVWARDFPTAAGTRENIIFVFAEGHDEILREDPWPYQTLEDFPVELLSFQTGVKEWYNKPGLVLAGADNVQALSNEILDSYLYVIRKMKNLILYDPEAVDEDTIDNILLAPDMSSHPVRGMANAPGAGIQALDLGRIPNDKGEMLNVIHSLFDRAAGTPQPVSKGVDTATESSIIERRTTAREARRGNLLADFQVRVAKKFWQLTTQYRPERLFLIHEQADQWVAIDDEIAKGEYRFQIDISSQAQAIALERKQWNDLLNLMSGLSGLFQQLYGPEAIPNLQKIARELLVRGYNVQNPEELLPGLLQQEQAQDLQTQAAIQQMLQGTPGQAPSEGPALTGPPRETESQERTGPALPRQFREPAPNGAGIQGNSQTP